MENHALVNRGFIALLLLAIVCSCSAPDDTASKDYTYLIHALNQGLFNTVVEDGFPPPVASRVYAYPNIAAYELAILNDDRFVSMAGQLNAFDTLPTVPPQEAINKNVAMVEAFSLVAKHMLYRDHLMDEVQQGLLEELKPTMDETVYNTSLAYGRSVAKTIKEWADTDGYNHTRTLPKYTVIDTPGAWLPTPPKYGEAIEPHWAKLRPFVMDSSSQFRIQLPFVFSLDTLSPFYAEVMKVYKIAQDATEEQLAIARFWDCNPVPVQIDGHLMVTNKQNTPPGHWLGITRLAALSHQLDLQETAEIYAQVTLAVADGFKSAWDTKFATNFIRPETYINKYIDPDWHPKLETPLFPEFTSAHSLISACAATVLAHRFGNDFSYTDSINVRFGIEPRQFVGFKQAAKEAAYSRVYGGIHYIPSCDLAFDQGTALGAFAVTKLQTRRDSQKLLSGQ